MNNALKNFFSIFDLLYVIIIFLFSPLLLLRMITDSRIRQNFFARLTPFLPKEPCGVDSGKIRIWVHAASVGEARIALKIIRTWRTMNDRLEFVLTTNTPTALELISKETEIQTAVAPIDFSILIHRFIQKTGVQRLLLIETEIWPNMIRLMSQRGKVLIVNGRLSDRFFHRYLQWSFLFKNTLSKIDFILARDKTSADRFQQLGIPSQKICCQGNLKYELPGRPPEEKLNAIKKKYGINEKQYIFIVGSIQPEELPVVVAVWKNLISVIPQFMMVIVPRHPEKREQFIKILKKLEVPFQMSSRDQIDSSGVGADAVFLIDETGILPAWYVLGNIAFVGGSLCKKGGQNMVEAIGFKKPVCIGPFASNFKDEVKLLQNVNAIKIVRNEAELSDFLLWCHQHPEKAAEMGENGYKAVLEQTSALKDNLQKLNEIFLPVK